MRRVVITGLGTVNALGPDVETSWRRMVAGENGIREIDFFDTTDIPVRFSGHVDYDTSVDFVGPDTRKLDPFTMYALRASREAVRDAGLDFASVDPAIRERYGCIIGTGIGGITGIEEQHLQLLERGPRRVSPHFIPKIMANAVSGQVAIEHGLMGTCFTTSSACASSGHSIGMALMSIRAGESDLVLTGGAESATTPLSVSGFNSARALSTRNDDPASASRPFDKERDGFVMGDGAGILVFEELEHARARGARIYAEVKGYGSTDDAFHITAPKEDGSGPARAIRLAMKSGGVDPETVDYVNAHGTSTALNDAMETNAIKAAFGDRARKLAISSTKSMIGHLLGASSAVELVATTLSIHHGVVHPTRNYTTPDPVCDLDYVPGSARELKVRNALSNSLGFGGHNVSICIGQLDS
ncbi:beta-ketoacyl-ACP synthase II [Engelhardtia mirabilis]|uniref:3-oxoacyl-[acyl-carrier-protein] synthase 2 n=1 Tax=Engelhardtia mirabilis TaxID=2528011 RepID=A0A518BKR0_9BACT|nr:3-oxoacyl-[acyl-carrier-protein] synthase 2 [Planctomycetes bacterium Pla133]QDV01859.1 3-oxoacyl-[acyl-carrier-protein] synthase 2 [Planctomycetes bacterium Pla86]